MTKIVEDSMPKFIINALVLSVYFLFIGMDASNATSLFLNSDTVIQPSGYQFQLNKTKNQNPYVGEQ